jgi:hypothetical protein
MVMRLCCKEHLLIGSQAYDSHCNLVLGDVEETIYVVEENEDDEEVVRVSNAACADLYFADIALPGRLSTRNQRCSLSEVGGILPCACAFGVGCGCVVLELT